MRVATHDDVCGDTLEDAYEIVVRGDPRIDGIIGRGRGVTNEDVTEAADCEPQSQRPARDDAEPALP
jgi:hypothetical protein